MTDDVISVVLVDDHTVVRAGLKAVLSNAPDIRVIGEASNGRDAIATASRLKPHVMVMDLMMGEMDGIEATKQIVADANGVPRVLVLTMHAEEEYLLQVLEAGASGYVVKSAADRELIDAVRAVAHGDVYVQPAAARVLARGIAREGKDADLHARYDKLTDREREVLRLVASGYTAPEIGEQLFISPKTVDTYRQRINEKMDIAHRSDYVRIALKLHLLKE